MARAHESKDHPLIHEAAHKLRTGRMSRREFVRLAAALGSAVPAVYVAGGSSFLRAPLHAQDAPRKGGVLRISMNVQPIKDPATYDWGEKGNLARQIIEPLVRIDADNVARPHLAESWEASDDLKTWTFRLRRGVRWSNGDAFDADDVVYNFRRWLDPATGSSNLARFSALTETAAAGRKDGNGNPVTTVRMAEGAVERVDDHTVRLHLKRPDIAVPQNLADYPTLIVHRRFDEEGGDLSQNPVGTGPFRLTEFGVGEMARFARRTDGYWGGPVHLDGLLFIDHGGDPGAQVAAFAAGEVDLNYVTSVDQVDTIEAIPYLTLHRTGTSATGVARMKVTEPPFDNRALRQAIRASVDHPRVLELAYRGYGAPGADHHVAPIHPAHVDIGRPAQDYALARRKLAEAGYADGVKLSIDCVATPSWEQNVCKALAEMLKPAGIDLAIDIMPGGTYWDRWLSTPFGLTAWQHRPLGTQTLNLAYRSDAGWNETSYANPEFDALLDEASATLEEAARRPLMAKLERMMQNDSIISLPFWRAVMNTSHERVRGYRIHPALELWLAHVWLA